MEAVFSSTDKQSFDLKLARALRSMLQTKPLYYFILSKVEKIYDPTFKAPAAVSLNRKTMKIKLILNPLFMKDFTADDLKILLEHEALHLAFNHLFSARKYSQKLLNQAMDYIINDNIPEFVARYSELLSENPSNKILANCCLAPRLSHIPELKNVDIKTMTTNALAAILAKHQVDEQQGFDEHSPEGEPTDGSSDDGSSGSQIDQAAVDKIMKEAFKEAEARPEGIGQIPGQIQSRVKEITKSKTNYKLVLQSFVGTLKDSEYEKTWARRSRRYPDQVKGKRTIYQPLLVIVIDTSGSMEGQKIKNAIAGEVKAISAVCKECWVIVGDTAETFRVQIKGGRMNTEISFKGGGGTDLQFGFDFAKKMKADGIVCYTDGLIPPPRLFGIKSIFCIYPNGKEVEGQKNIIMEV
jgi:predicted metal-dependent peptidase